MYRYFSTHPEHIDAFIPSCYDFKNSVAVEIGLLHSQPFTSSHFCFFIIVEPAICCLLPLPSPLYLWLYSPLLGLGRFFSVLIFYTVGRTPWTGDQPRRKASTCKQDSTKRINAHRHPCLKWDSNPRSQCLSGRRQFMP
jgi:hypothetical protein